MPIEERLQAPIVAHDVAVEGIGPRRHLLGREIDRVRGGLRDEDHPCSRLDLHRDGAFNDSHPEFQHALQAAYLVILLR